MRSSFRMLVLTDHSGHSNENSLYGLVSSLRTGPSCRYIDVGSRGCIENEGFFGGYSTELYVKRIGRGFAYSRDGNTLTTDLVKSRVTDYDILLLRLPPPPDREFFHHLTQVIPQRTIINRPDGILKTSSKEFLLQFAKWCPPICLCKTADDVNSFSAFFPVVLKPLNGYGGRGIIKIENNVVWKDNKPVAKDEFLNEFDSMGKAYLGMRYLRNVSLGDKRNIVVNGKLIGASLRLPAEGGWMCNVAMGGRSSHAVPDAREEVMARELWAVLKDLGIVLFGFDTLVDDDGRRVLSEINTMSSGGLVQSKDRSGNQIVEEAADLIWDFISKEIYGNVPANLR